MSQLETDDFPIDEWNISSFPDDLEFDSLEDLLKDQGSDLPTPPTANTLDAPKPHKTVHR